MPLPTSRFFAILSIGFVLSILGFLFPSVSFLQLIFYAGLLIACVIDFLTVIRPKDLVVNRLHEKYLSIGAHNPVRVRVENRSAGSGNIIVRDEYPPEFVTEDDTRYMSLNGPGYAVALYHVRPFRKGAYHFGRIFLRVEGRWGLLKRQYRYYAPSEATVYPNVIEMKKYLRMVSLNRLEQIGYKKKLPGGESEFDFLREYQQGDEYRKINWKATAKRRYPIVQVYEREYNRNIVVLLDSGRMMTTRYDELTKLDHAIDTSLILAAAAQQKKDHFGMLCFSNEIESFLAPKRNEAVLTTVLSTLYRITPTFSKTDYLQAYRFMKNKVRKNSIVFVFSELYNSVVSADLIQLLKMLAPRHRVHFVSFEEWEEEVPGKNHFEITRWALQQDQIVDKETLIRELAKSGIHTIRVNSQNIKQKVVNAYLSS